MARQATTTRINVSITSEQRQMLDKLQEQTGAPITWLIQRAIDMYLESRRKEINK